MTITSQTLTLKALRVLWKFEARPFGILNGEKSKRKPNLEGFTRSFCRDSLVKNAEDEVVRRR